jgi:hypothetical protein
MPDTIKDLAEQLTSRLAAASIAEMTEADVDALDRLTDAVTWDLREQIQARQRALWRASAITSPPAGTLTRTVVVDSDYHPDWISDVALVQRTDTGQLYIVSTNDDETMTWQCDANGNRYPHPAYDDCTEDNIVVASGRGLTRAEAIHALDRAEGGKLAPGYPAWDDDDDDED